MINSNRSKLEKVYKAMAMARLIKAGRLVQKTAKHITAVDTGELQASISVNWTDGPKKGRVEKVAKAKGISAPTTPFTVRIGTTVPYGIYVEVGTSKMAAQPYLRPALLGAKRAFAGKGVETIQEFVSVFN